MTSNTFVPNLGHVVPVLNHRKKSYYIDFPIINNDTIANEAFYVEHDFTIVSSNISNTALYKWNGTGWTEVTGLSNPDVIFGRGFYSVTTTANESVAITEHVNP